MKGKEHSIIEVSEMSTLGIFRAAYKALIGCLAVDYTPPLPPQQYLSNYSNLVGLCVPSGEGAQKTMSRGILPLTLGINTLNGNIKVNK